jgi:hypothetical protein
MATLLMPLLENAMCPVKNSKGSYKIKVVQCKGAFDNYVDKKKGVWGNEKSMLSRWYLK